MEENQKKTRWHLGDDMSDTDQVQNERISKVEERMLMLEQAILEMRGMAKTIKLVVIFLRSGVRRDLHGVLL